MLVSLSQWELCIDFEGSKMKAQVRYLGLYILVINNKYWLLSWQVLKIIFPILQVTKIKAERLNALCSATGEEHWRTKRLRELLTVNSELNLPEIWQIEQAADQKGGIYWLKSQRNALRSLVDWVKHGLKEGQETFPCIETAVCVVCNEGVEEPLKARTSRVWEPWLGILIFMFTTGWGLTRSCIASLAQWEVKLQCADIEAPSEPACLVYCV